MNRFTCSRRFEKRQRCARGAETEASRRYVERQPNRLTRQRRKSEGVRCWQAAEWVLAGMLAIMAGCNSLRPQSPTVPSRPMSEPSPPAADSAVSSGQAEQLELSIALETARLAEQRGMDDEAIAHFERARAISPRIRGVSHSLAVLYDRAGRTDAAEREYAEALREKGDDADLLCDYGYFLYSTGRWADAEQRLRTALRARPDHRQTKVNLGLVLGMQGQFAEAEELFTTTIGPAAAQHNIGMLKLRQGQVAEACHHLEEAARRDPSSAATQVVLAGLRQQAFSGDAR